MRRFTKAEFSPENNINNTPTKRSTSLECDILFQKELLVCRNFGKRFESVESAREEV